MKKRLVAIVLSMAMCFTTVVQAGAAELSFSDSVEPVAVQEDIQGTLEEASLTQGASQEIPDRTDEAEVQEETLADAGFSDGVFSDGEEIGQEEEIPEEVSGMEEDLFSAGISANEDVFPAESGSITVDAEDWEQSGKYFKLRKTTVSAAQAVQAVSEEVLSAQISDESEDPEPDVNEETQADAAAETGTYYTAADGLMRISTVYKERVHTGYYLFDENGYMVTGQKTVKAGTPGTSLTADTEFYFTAADTASLYAGCEGESVNPCSSDLGQQKRNYWLWTGKAFRFYDAAGKVLSHGIMATKLNTELMGDRIYLIDKNGYILKGVMKKAEDGAYYCTDSRGIIYQEKLVRYNGYRYYFGKDGKRETWTKSWHRCKGASNRYYYFGSTPGRVVEKTGWQKVVKETGTYYGWFYFDKNGNHYVDKLTSTGYYFTSLGKLAGGVVEINGKKYLFEPSDSTTHRGKMYKNTLVYYKNKWFYATASGALRKSNWIKIDGNWYYFENYRALTKRFMKKNGVNGYLDSTGKYTTGWVVVSNSKNLVKYIDPDGDGFVQNGSKWINGLLYYFDKNGYRINDLTSMYGGPYYVEVDKTNGVMTIYNSTRTVPVKSIRVSVGQPWTPTPSGTYTLRRSLRWQPLMGPSWGQYGTHVEGAGQGGIFVHSIACGHANSYALPVGEYNKLGNPASHGCIRTCVADAKWVYDNCNGATIRIFSGTYNANEVFKGPLGRRALVPATGSFDPTDPAV